MSIEAAISKRNRKRSVRLIYLYRRLSGTKFLTEVLNIENIYVVAKRFVYYKRKIVRFFVNIKIEYADISSVKK